MLLAGTSRDGFRPRTPDHTNNEAVAITANATIKNARSSGMPKRTSNRLSATRKRPRPARSRTSPTAKAVRLVAIRTPALAELRPNERDLYAQQLLALADKVEQQLGR